MKPLPIPFIGLAVLICSSWSQSVRGASVQSPLEPLTKTYPVSLDAHHPSLLRRGQRQAEPVFVRASYVYVTGLHIQKQEPGAGPGRADTFGYFLGTHLTLFLTQRGHYLIGIDETKSQIIAFKDDLGSNLMKISTRDADTLSEPLSQPDITEDGQQCSVEVEAPGTPAKGAHTIILKANIVFDCGRNLRRFRSAERPLQRGETLLSLPSLPVRLTVHEVSKPTQYSPFPQGETISISLNSPSNRIKNLRFFTSNGQEIASDYQGGDTGDSDTMAIMNYALEKKVSQARVEVTYFDKIDKLRIPINVHVKPGF